MEAVLQDFCEVEDGLAGRHLWGTKTKGSSFGNLENIGQHKALIDQPNVSFHEDTNTESQLP